jgi:CubicO group peptidase (beta-lactamase class C family)
MNYVRSHEAFGFGSACSYTAAILLTSAGLFAAPAAPKSGDWDVREVEGFVDGLIEGQTNAHHFAGAVVVIVRDGRVFVQKGYGYSDFAARQPVDPRRTLFRIGSNSKMFVWTAVMQLVEEGKLDLRTDVNQYLKGVQVPPTFPTPITLAHLMSHTAGFEDRIVGLFAKTPDKMRPLAELMKDDMPNRIFAPGTVTAYSNYGAALAALIVEQVSGLPFEKYLEERILTPLGMKNATIAQPVPSAMAENLSKGYQWTNGRLKEQPFEYVPWAPIGGMSVSGEDMGRFMIAQLNDGALGTGRILRPETARAMRERLISFSPRINGVEHGFFEMNSNGETIFGHGGSTLWFNSVSAMIPARNLGLFVAYNTDSARPATFFEFFDAFFDHYFPSPLAKEPPPPKGERANLQRFSGTYFEARRSVSDLTKILTLLNAVSLAADPDGYLVSNEGQRWRQVEPTVFSEVDGKAKTVFRLNESGDVADMCTSPTCVFVLQRQPWWSANGVQFAWIGVCAAILTLALFGFPIVALSQRGLANSLVSKLARITAWLTSLLFLAGIAVFAGGLRNNPTEIVFGIPPMVQAGLRIWVAASILSVGLLGFAAAAWKQKWWARTGRVSLTVVCVAAIGFAAWLNHWNLLG